MSAVEMQKYGLSGLITDVLLCPTEFHEGTGTSVVKGPCELVTCQMKRHKLVCTARKTSP